MLQGDNHCHLYPILFIPWPSSWQARHYSVQWASWGNKIGTPHMVPCTGTGCCSSVLVCFILNTRTHCYCLGLMSAKLPLMAGTGDCSARGCTAPVNHFAKATLNAVSKMDSSLTPDLWKEVVRPPSLSGIHWPSPQDPHHSLCAQGPGPAVATKQCF